MHIPDGYLSPQTYAPAYAVMAPVWWRASAVLRRTLRNRQVPILALGAAFSFVIMMFNVPIPGGSTGHAVGGVLVAILLGPWAAVVAVTLALVVQALMFGDGGVTALGANCLNMAVLMPFAGWGVYRLIARGAPADSRRQWIGAAVGGYVGLNVAALSAGLMFGIQPLIAHDAAGHALYCPYGLRVAIPAMCGSHLLLFGFVEAAVTGLVVAYLQRVEPELILYGKPRYEPLALSRPPQEAVSKGGLWRRRPWARAALVVLVLIVLSPLGLYLPARFGAGTAWGEWSADEIAKLTGYVPAGMRHEAWNAPMPDYSLPGRESASLAAQGVTYVLAAVAGVVAIGLCAFVLRKLIWRKKLEADP